MPGYTEEEIALLHRIRTTTSLSWTETRDQYFPDRNTDSLKSKFYQNFPEMRTGKRGRAPGSAAKAEPMNNGNGEINAFREMCIKGTKALHDAIEAYLAPARQQQRKAA